MPALSLVTIASATLQAADIPLPPPTGMHPVGTVTYEWVDSARVDSMASPPAPRTVLVRIWYPARRVEGAASAPYVERIEGATTEWAQLHARVRAHAIARTPFLDASRRAPVIVFAPGRSTATFDYTSLGEDLASHGYVVVGVDSPHHSKVVRGDGSLAPILFPSMGPSTYPDGFDRAQEPMNHLVGADLRYAFQRLATLDRDDPILRGRLDLTRVAMAGHSNGGMAGSRACAEELACRAFLGIEGMQTRELRKHGVDRPYGLVYSEQTLAFDTLRIFTEMRLNPRAPFTLYRVNDAGHNSFTDLLLVRPALFSYPMPARRGVDVTRAIVRGFFDQYLLGREKTDALAAFPEVTIELYTPQQATVKAELFGEGVFSTGDYELPPTFTKDGRTAYFTVSTPQYGRIRWILETHRRGERWSEPTVAAFSGRYDDADPWISPDGNQLFFLSKRPIGPGSPPKRDLDIWVMNKQANGSWGEPRHLGSKVNGQGEEHYVTATTDGTLYIAAVRPDSRNLGDLYRVPFVNGEYGEPVNLGSTLNMPETHETTPYVAPDGSYLIFGSRGRPDSHGDLDLYITMRDSAGNWSAPRNLGPGVNSSAGELCPIVSPDGRYLYFTSLRSFIDGGPGDTANGRDLKRRLRSPGNGLGDTYRVPLAPILAAVGLRGAQVGRLLDSMVVAHARAQHQRRSSNQYSVVSVVSHQSVISH